MVLTRGCTGFPMAGVLGVALAISGYLVPANAQTTPPEPAKEITVDVLEHFEKVQKIVARHRKEARAKKLNFTALPKDQLLRKLGRTSTPLIIFQSWDGSTAPGGTISYNVGVYNPDPYGQIWMFGHVFIGPANIVGDVGDALQTVDARFPRLTLPAFPGLSLAAGATETLRFKVKVPSGVDASNYLGNTFLFRADWHDVGKYLDRSIFVFEVR